MLGAYRPGGPYTAIATAFVSRRSDEKNKPSAPWTHREKQKKKKLSRTHSAGGKRRERGEEEEMREGRKAIQETLLCALSNSQHEREHRVAAVDQDEDVHNRRDDHHQHAPTADPR